MAVTLQHKKIELIQWLSTLDDISIIEKIIQLRKTESTDWWKETSTAEKKNPLKKELPMPTPEN